MAISPVKILLFVAGGAAAAAAVTAYVSGALDPYFGPPPQQVTALAPAPVESPPAQLQPADSATTKMGRLPGETPSTPAAHAPVPSEPPAQDSSESPSPAVEPALETAPVAQPGGSTQPQAPAVAPSFDVVRVEADGSMVIAGRAGPGSKVDVVAGASVIASTSAGGDGDFAVVLDKPLQPGDYQISLRSTGPGEVVASSTETAIVSVPQNARGEVLAMVEEPGRAAELITVPEAPAPASAGQLLATPEPVPLTGAPAAPGLPGPEEPPTPDPAAAPPPGAQGGATSPADESAAETGPSAVAPAPVNQASPAEAVAVEAVEIEGRMVFVAGTAAPGRRVRAYAGSFLLGDAVASSAGRFLVEAERDLPVGDYLIRVDALDTDGATVVARAAVPFEREPGETIAAVASRPAADAPANPSPAVTGPAAAGSAGVDPPAFPTDATTAPGTSSSSAAVAEPGATVTASQRGASESGSAPPVFPTAEVEIAAAPASDAPPPSEGMQVTAPKLQNVEGAVIIRRGDTLWRISRRVYGRGTRYSTIYLANQEQIRDPDLIWPGQVFKVPGKSNEGEAADMSKIGGQVTTVPGEAGEAISR